MTKQTFDGITIGTVIDTNDPQQMGRVRAVCPALGDKFEDPLGDIPWATYSTPFGGVQQSIARGPGDDDKQEGATSYGMWAIPKVGAQVLIMCIDGNPTFRIWMGCVYTANSANTMPHGRFSYQDNTELEGTGKPEGPFSSFENFIEPIHTNYIEAYGEERENNPEWRTRGADFSVSAVDPEAVQTSLGDVADDKDIEFDGVNIRQGYEVSRSQPDKEFASTGKNYDSQVYAITSPGFHAFSMDDRKENCRIRIRTTSGHQIILDDTNERIYISTAEGKSWIEMDQNGNIDIHSERRISIHSAKDINLTSEETIRMHAKSIHMVATESVDDEGKGIRMHSAADINIIADENIRMHSVAKAAAAGSGIFLESNYDIHMKITNELYIRADDNIHIDTGADMKMTAADDFHIKSVGGVLNLTAGDTIDIDAGAVMKITAADDFHIKSGGVLFLTAGGGNVNINASGDILNTGSAIHLNGPGAPTAGSAVTADPADEADPSLAFYAYSVNRIPLHEPFRRRMVSDDNTINDETSNIIDEDSFIEPEMGIYALSVDDDDVGRVELDTDEPFERGPNWRR